MLMKLPPPLSVVLSLPLVWVGFVVSAGAAVTDELFRGSMLFEQQCASCHSLGQDGFGPPLGGITLLLDKAAFARWIRDPAGVIATGDERAVALLRRYKVAMPPFAHLTDDDVAALRLYLESASEARNLKPLAIDPRAAPAAVPRLLPPVQPSGLAVELEDYAQIPRLPGRTAYKGITQLRADPRAGGALFVNDLMGLLYGVRDRQPAVFLDVRPYFPGFMCDPGVASGLGSFALHPAFARNGIFYTTHSELRHGSPAANASDIPADVPKYETPPLEWVVTEWTLADPAATVFAGTHREVMRFVTPTTGHGSQEIAFSPVTDPHDPDYAKLYLGLGDGGSINLKRPDMAGHPHTFLGAILRIDPAGHDGAGGGYGIPGDNPFAASADPTVRREIWAYGFRNAHRLSWDFAHGRRMIAVDIGEANIEEINLVEKGGAYGWGVRGIEGTMRLDPKVDAKVVRLATEEEMAGVIPPFAAYDHTEGPAITGGYVYHGPLAELRDTYVFGDIVNGRLFFVKMGADLADRTIYELTIIREGALVTVKSLAGAQRAHLRLGYDERTGDLYVLTKDDGMIRRVSAVHRR